MKKIILLITAASLTIACGSNKKAVSGREAQPYQKNEGVIRLATYNVGVFKKSGELQIDAVADMMKEIGADVISMNELDSCANRTSRQYQLKLFADAMGAWDFFFGSAMPYDGGSYGSGVAFTESLKSLGKYRIPLPKVDGAEPRVCAVVEFDKFVFAATHLDHVSAAARLAQLGVINEWIDSHYGNPAKPVFLCGDFNATPDSETISELRKDWDILSVMENTHPADTPVKCIDYICVKKGTGQGVETVGTAVMDTFKSADPGVVSDHLPVYVDVKF